MAMSGVRKGVSWATLRTRALGVHTRLMKYHHEHPKETWQQLYDAVPNHYANWSALRSAMQRLKATKRVKHIVNLTRSGYNAYGNCE